LLVGGVVGVIGGTALRWVLRAVPLAEEGLRPLRTLAAAMLLFGIAAAAHGSGFLAVFVAGIIVGDGPWPHERQIRSFHSSLASLGEIVAFVVLGLTFDLGVLGHRDVWVPGLALGALLAIVVRPAVVGLCLLPVRLPWNERAFVLLAGLKGAVPILLGTFLLAERVDEADRLYGIVVVVVIFSVVVQGGLVPTAVRRLGLPLRSDDDGEARSL
jgi:cell volume regulation protein A